MLPTVRNPPTTFVEPARASNLSFDLHRQRCATREAEAQGRKVVGFDLRKIQHRRQNCRHDRHHRRLFAMDEFQRLRRVGIAASERSWRRIRCRRSSPPSSRRRGISGSAPRMHLLAVLKVDAPRHDLHGVCREVGMSKHRALRRAGRAAGVLQHCHVFVRIKMRRASKARWSPRARRR